MGDENRGWFELQGAGWKIGPGWNVIYESIAPDTGMLLAVTEHPGRKLIKAELCGLFHAEAWPSPRWESCEEAFFGSGDLEEAIQYLRVVNRKHTK